MNRVRNRTTLSMRTPFVVNGRQVWLSSVQQDLLSRMRTDGWALYEENGRLILECADGSSRPCGCDPQGVRAQIVDLECLGLLVSHPQQGHWSLTDHGRALRAELTTARAA